MTRRSRAIRLVTFGQDNQNVVFLLQAARKTHAVRRAAPVRYPRSVTQFDETF